MNLKRPNLDPMQIHMYCIFCIHSLTYMYLVPVLSIERNCDVMFKGAEIVSYALSCNKSKPRISFMSLVRKY